MDAETKGRKAVSRRGAPAADKSFKRASTSTHSASAKSPASRDHSPSRALSHHKKKTEAIEMRPLLFKGTGSAGEEGGGGITSNQPASNASSPAAAKQFADSWLGNYVKLKAKQAEKHAYNLRANLKSKKGFHVQIPKRMLFYTVLVFLVLPLILFIMKEQHIHDHDPAFHLEKFSKGKNPNNSTIDPLFTRRDDTNKQSQNVKQQNKKNAAVRGKNYNHQQHQSLKQLLAGGLPTNATTSNSRSAPGGSSKKRKDSSKKLPIATGVPEAGAGTDDIMQRDSEEEEEPNSSSEQSTNPSGTKNATSLESDVPLTGGATNQNDDLVSDADSSGNAVVSGGPKPETESSIPPLLLAKNTTATLLPGANNTSLRRTRRRRR